MFDPHKIPSYFLTPPNKRRRRSNRNSFSSVSSFGEVEAGEPEPVIGRTTHSSPPSSPSFLFRNAVLLHVNPDAVAENAGCYDDDDDGEDRDG